MKSVEKDRKSAVTTEVSFLTRRQVETVELRFREAVTSKVPEAVAEAFILAALGSIVEEKWNYLERRSEVVRNWFSGKSRLRELFLEMLAKTEYGFDRETAEAAFERALRGLLARGLVEERTSA